MVEADQLNFEPHKKHPRAENKLPTGMLNEVQGTDQATKRQKGVEIQTITVGVQARAKACGTPPTEKWVIRTGKKVFIPPLPSTYKETELLKDINGGMEYVLIYY